LITRKGILPIETLKPS